MRRMGVRRGGAGIRRGKGTIRWAGRSMSADAEGVRAACMSRSEWRSTMFTPEQQTWAMKDSRLRNSS